MDDGSSVGTVVLVHGGFVDGSGWQGVYQKLGGRYSVSVVQNPTLSLAGDAEVGTRRRGRHDQRARLAEQAELVSRHNR